MFIAHGFWLSLISLATHLDGQPIITLPPKYVKLKKVEFSEEERYFYSRLEADSRAQFQVCLLWSSSLVFVSFEICWFMDMLFLYSSFYYLLSEQGEGKSSLFI